MTKSGAWGKWLMKALTQSMDRFIIDGFIIWWYHWYMVDSRRWSLIGLIGHDLEDCLLSPPCSVALSDFLLGWGQQPPLSHPPVTSGLPHRKSISSGASSYGLKPLKPWTKITLPLSRFAQALCHSKEKRPTQIDRNTHLRFNLKFVPEIPFAY